MTKVKLIQAQMSRENFTQPLIVHLLFKSYCYYCMLRGLLLVDSNKKHTKYKSIFICVCSMHLYHSCAEANLKQNTYDLTHMVACIDTHSHGIIPCYQ